MKLGTLTKGSPYQWPMCLWRLETRSIYNVHTCTFIFILQPSIYVYIYIYKFTCIQYIDKYHHPIYKRLYTSACRRQRNDHIHVSYVTYMWMYWGSKREITYGIMSYQSKSRCINPSQINKISNVMSNNVISNQSKSCHVQLCICVLTYVCMNICMNMHTIVALRIICMYNL